MSRKQDPARTISLDETQLPGSRGVKRFQVAGALPQGRRTAAEPNRLRARIVYTSLDKRGPAGLGPNDETVVQVVCNAGDYNIDLQIEPELEAGEMVVVGQVVDRTASAKPLAAAAVRLMAKKKLVAAGETNTCGEFCLVSRLQNSFTLYIDLDDAGQRVGIPLNRLTAGFRP